MTDPSIRDLPPDTDGPRREPPSAVITSSIGLLAGLTWLALPDLALANDCFTAGEVLDCVLTTPPILFGLLGGALLGAALWGAMSGPPAPPPDVAPVYRDRSYEPMPEDMYDYEPQPGDPDYEEYMVRGWMMTSRRCRRARNGPPASVGASIGLLAGVIWLALPELTVANDCFTAGEVLDCVLTTPPVLFGLLGAALLGAALWGAMSGPPPPDEEASEEDDGDDLPPELFRRRRPPPDEEASEED